MLLKSKETCKWKNECPHRVMGENKCFGAKENREGCFSCCLVDKDGEFKPLVENKHVGANSRVF